MPAHPEPDVGALVRRLATRLSASTDASIPVDLQLAALIGGIDRAVHQQLDAILHSPPFRAAESAWRALRHLATEVPRDRAIRICVLSVTRAELAGDFAAAPELEMSRLFQLVHDTEFGRLGGEPFAALIVDGDFSHRDADLRLLGRLAGVAAASHCLLLSAASPELIALPAWSALRPDADLTASLARTEAARWRALRANPDMRYVALVAPRVLLRAPHMPGPERWLAYRERIGARDHAHLCWGSAAFALAAGLARAFHASRWCAAIAGLDAGGEVKGLPRWGFSTDRLDVASRPPIETGLTSPQERALVGAGIIPLCRVHASPRVAFFALPCLHAPPARTDRTAAANEDLGVQVPYLLAASRFAHYLKCMLRDAVGRHTTPGEIERRVGEWLGRHTLDDAHATPERRARHPLRAFHVAVKTHPGRPGHYALVAQLRPHTHQQEAAIALRVVTDLSAAVG